MMFNRIALNGIDIDGDIAAVAVALRKRYEEGLLRPAGEVMGVPIFAAPSLPPGELRMYYYDQLVGVILGLERG